MIIGIDGNEANVQRRVGISEYGFELLKNFKFQISNFKFQIYLKKPPLPHMPKERDGWRYRIVRPEKLWTQIGLPIDLFFHKPRPDVFFSPTHYAPRFSPVNCAISIMDVSYLRFPSLFNASDLYQLKNWTAYSVKKAVKIFTISKSSKNDIIKAYGVSEEKVVVTYPGVKFKNMVRQTHHPEQSRRTMQNSKVLEKYGVDRNYVLFVGTLQPRKNIERLIEAFSLVCHPELVSGSQSKRDSDLRQNDIQLIIVGKKGWLYEDILEAPKKFGVENSVKFLEFVPEEDLSSLYQNALFFILPSLYEGFGLPVLEAMSYGCPVITSNVSSLPEVGGDAVLYVDPLSTSDICEKMRMIFLDEKLRAELQKKGYEQVKKFNWEKTAKQTLDILENLAQK
ncbi:MAG: hypothetical protein A3B53_02375 [Candidatus Levybacteria bacterium RIFCSPLOWO2_01_FULL_42_15]|nr:MAG: hypothetical protein A3B53_02375 [Candidatus Levybacteria bacterium RIFCSPLOWO2_01_FULL_42_15]